MAVSYSWTSTDIKSSPVWRRQSVVIQPKRGEWPYLRIPLSDSSIFMPGDDVLVEITPSSHRSLAFLASDSQTVLVDLVRQVVSVPDIIDNDRAQMTHPLFCDREQLFAIFAELNALDGRWELPRLQTFASPHIP